MRIAIYLIGLIIGVAYIASRIGGDLIAYLAALIVWGACWSIIYGLVLLGFDVGRKQDV